MGYLDNTGLAYFWQKIKSNFLPATKEIPANADLNDYRTPGIYYCPQNTTAATLDNVPGPYAFSLQVYKTVWTSGGDEGCKQILMTYENSDTSENTNRIWIRTHYKNGGWTDWYQIVTSMDRPIEYTTIGYDSTANSTYTPWHKVAEFPYTHDDNDRRVVLTVTDSYMRTLAPPYGSVNLKYGILHVHIHRKNDFATVGKDTCKLTWNLNTGYNVDDFVLVHIPSTNALELWTKVPYRYNFRTFNLVENANVAGGNRYRQRSINPIEMRGRIVTTGSASYPTGDGYTVIKSEAAVIEQPSRGLLDLGVYYNKSYKSRLTTAYNFEAGKGLLEYFNSGSDMTVENGGLTCTDDVTRFDSHMLRLPWDNQNGCDSILAIPSGSTGSAGYIAAMAWRGGIGSNGLTTDENGVIRQTAYTDWFHLIDDRFTIDGVHVKKQHTTHYGVCSTAAATAVKTVDIPGFELVTGAYVIVTFTVTNSAAVANLKLNVSNTGDKPIKHRNGNFPAAGELIANRPFMFVYDGTNWQLAIDIDHNTNNYERVRTYYPIKAKSAISKQHVIVAGEDGLYFMLTSGNPFSIKYPPLYATDNIAANAKNANAYYFGFLDTAVITNEAAETLTLNKALYIKGHLNGTTFTPFATKSLVCTEPTTEDGYQYLKLGVVKAYTTSNDALRAQIEIEHPIYEYVNGSFCLYEPKASNSDIDSIFD